MKRDCILAYLLAVAAVALPAESFLLLGGSIGYVSQNTAAMHPWSATSLSLMEQSSIDLTESFGMYSAATIGFIIGAQDNGIVLDPGQYQTISLNVLLGVGWSIALERLTGVAGVGVYFGSNTLNSSNNTFSSYAAGGVGGGIGASLIYSLSYNWGVGANVNAAYYFMIPGEIAPAMAPSGVSVFGGIGFVYFFRSTRYTGSGVSRY
jgi:hypothetical protein